MLTIYRDVGGVLKADHSLDPPEHIVWIDLLNATEQEKAAVEARLHLRIPSMEALNEIESSSRLVVQDGTIYLSMPVVAQGDTADPFLSPVGFILSAALLVTVRFAELPIFPTVADKIAGEGALRTSTGIFTALMEALVDRGADVLERLGSELDRVSRAVFRGDPNKVRHSVRSNAALRQTLSTVGRIGDRLSQARDVFLGVGRIVSFVVGLPHDWIIPAFETRLTAVAKDIASLNDYEAHLSAKVQFLLDAVLGFITIEQNDLFKVLTIVSVVGIPPTLVAGIYGMNFRFMPELSWPWGYPFGLGVIVLSALVPLIWLRLRGWF